MYVDRLIDLPGRPHGIALYRAARLATRLYPSFRHTAHFDFLHALFAAASGLSFLFTMHGVVRSYTHASPARHHGLTSYRHWNRPRPRPRPRPRSRPSSVVPFSSGSCRIRRRALPSRPEQRSPPRRLDRRTSTLAALPPSAATATPWRTSGLPRK